MMRKTKKKKSQFNVIEISSVKARRQVSYLAWGLVVLTWCIAMLGAYVRLSDAGLGCPDWPGCYGYWYVPHQNDPVFSVHPVWSKALLESSKAWKEMLHRYAVSLLGGGILVLVLALEWCRYRFNQRWISPLWSVLLVVWLILQAIFGMWTVTLKLMPLIVTSHLLGGMLLLVWISCIATRLSGRALSQGGVFRPRWAVGAVWLIVLLQIIVGGWVSSHYAAGACGNSFPLCRDTWIPHGMNWEMATQLWHPSGLTQTGSIFPVTGLIAIHWLHRVGAVVVLVAVCGLVGYGIRSKQPRRWTMALSHALVLQLFLGFANIFWNLPLWSAVAHNGGAALLLVILTIMMAI